MNYNMAVVLLQAQTKRLKKINKHRFLHNKLEVELRIEGGFAPVCYVNVRKAGAKSRFIEVGSFEAYNITSTEMAVEKAKNVVDDTVIDVTTK